MGTLKKVGIYKITNTINNKVYIGKSIDINRRFAYHRYYLKSDKDFKKQVNRHLKNAVDKYGIENFKFEILELFDIIDPTLIADREVYWMDFYQSFDSDKGYNLKRDSSTSITVSGDTRRLQSEVRKGSNNANFGNKWTDEQKQRASEIQIERHKQGLYGEEWKNKIGEASTRQWSDLEHRKQMGQKVKVSRRKFNFEQYTREGEFIKVFESVEDIIKENPNYKWQNIYSVCNGYKKTYMNFIWKKINK